MNIIPLKNWFEDFKCDPLFIAGPCSAESEEQVIKIASQLKENASPPVYRAGLWKPRTRPGSFSGVGIKGLKWLIRVKEEFGYKITVEVANPRHVEACLKAGIDIFWVGARSVSNPFSVDEIAGALQGVDIPVLVKNPLNPDIDLWIGAIERVARAGVTRIAAIHRGFSPFERTRYRNMPKWEIPIELRRRIINLPVLCDPSHMSGDATLVNELAQKAMDLNMAGLMTEVHHDPPNAMSDNKQQLTPVRYGEMINRLVVRNPDIDDPGFLNDLEELRNQVDSIDFQIVELISRRMEISDQLGDYKYHNNVAVLQMERWMEVLRTRNKHAARLGIDTTFTEKLLKLFHQESIRRQIEVMNKLKAKANGSGNNAVDD
ncbi:MAG: bifunctional 3-deoxy-7-phosphoheptulonate synthase/chorismate mutase type II [Bacteroidales bacterium]|nr:bifunctional 3-deoxy-7-phosphoheptulonate synthase/chorismate mutase type II [Bacteroidales bacterium]